MIVSPKLLSVVVLAAAWCVAPVSAQAPAAPAAPEKQAPGEAPAPAPEVPAPGPMAEAGPATTTPLAHVEVRGSGPVPMVLIPGLLADWTAFEPFMDRNAEKFTMYAVTLPGFGGSEPPPEPGAGSYTQGPWLENAERAILAMIEERKLEKPVLLGQSMGGHIALRLASEQPEKFRSVIVLNSMAAYPVDGPGRVVSKEDRAQLVDKWLLKDIDDTPPEEWQAKQRDWVVQSVSDPAKGESLAERSTGIPKEVSKRYMLEYIGADITDELPKADLPLLVIAAIPPADGGDLSEVREMWPALFAGAPKETVVLFEDTRELILEDAPAELDRAVKQFLAGEKVEGKPAAKAEAPQAPSPTPAPAPAEPKVTPEPAPAEPQPQPAPDEPAPTTHPPPSPEPRR